ncbi:hypothetical protein [Terriglobus roseus]|uniref:hypothetical protein n=1 Tax=Terriglobus roseus TaxID=392734 RepID=UPI00094352DA|nr:hypothetical protein [Terriglobus roseus]
MESALDKSAIIPPEFASERKKLERAKADYQGLEPEKAKRLAALQAAREQKQRQHYLERFRIEDEVIPGIGPKYKADLRGFNIEDAWDIDAGLISGIKGFGKVKVNTLVAWRRSKEAGFRFDPSLPVDPRDIYALDREFLQKRQTLQNTLRSGPQALRQTVSVWQAQRRQTQAQLHRVAKDLAQANVNRIALRAF